MHISAVLVQVQFNPALIHHCFGSTLSWKVAWQTVRTARNSFHETYSSSVGTRTSLFCLAQNLWGLSITWESPFERSDSQGERTCFSLEHSPFIPGESVFTRSWDICSFSVSWWRTATHKVGICDSEHLVTCPPNEEQQLATYFSVLPTMKSPICFTMVFHHEVQSERRLPHSQQESFHNEPMPLQL